MRVLLRMTQKRSHSPAHPMCKAHIVALLLLSAYAPAARSQSSTVDEATTALKRASQFMREKVATRGGYLWQYSTDLTGRWGEGKATATQIWVQPPGTPTVGTTFLQAYQRTGDDYYLDAAREAAHALTFGQMQSGGWDYRIDFAPPEQRQLYYRHDAAAGRPKPDNARSYTVFDDDTSQSALRFLMQYDRATRFTDTKVADAVRYALERFLQGQYPNGAWPQRYERPCDPAKCPVQPASYPDSWSRVYPDPKPNFRHYYTLNDHVMHDMIQTMLLAHEIYGRQECLLSARRGGDFLLLAQMPEPQPAWAQQYDLQMRPAWARRFEPPSIVTTESLGVLTALMDLYVATGDHKYHRTIPKALAWFDRVRRPDGRRARFYELTTDKPLYFNKKYELVYTDDDTPTHYGFVTELNTEAFRRRHSGLDRERAQYLKHEHRMQVPPIKMPRPSQVRSAIDTLDEQGRWLDEDRIRCATFVRNTNILSSYILKMRKGK